LESKGGPLGGIWGLRSFQTGMDQFEKDMSIYPLSFFENSKRHGGLSRRISFENPTNNHKLNKIESLTPLPNAVETATSFPSRFDFPININPETGIP